VGLLVAMPINFSSLSAQQPNSRTVKFGNMPKPVSDGAHLRLLGLLNQQVDGLSYIRKYVFLQRVIEPWNSLPASSDISFKRFISSTDLTELVSI
jgi:hypothetical protein